MINAIEDKLPDLKLESTLVTAADNKTLHLAGTHKAKSLQVWPDEWIDSLPEHFRNYRAVLLDTKSGNLVVIPEGSFNARTPKIVIRLNYASKNGTTAAVVSLGTAPLGDLAKASQYEIILGSLKK